MTKDNTSSTSVPAEELAEALRRVRQLDPTADEEAVRGYLREIAEASAVLDRVDLGDAPLHVSYSASWPERAVR